MNYIRRAVALGSFDGLHKGHKAVLACALSYGERGLVPCALLFASHPLLTLTGCAPEEILQSSVRDRLLYGMGGEEKFIDFTEVCAMSPDEFFEEILVKRLSAGAVCCGENYRFGSGGAGGVKELKALCEKNGVSLTVAPTVMFVGEPVSSTRIRFAVKQGDIPLANAMLGRPFCYEAVVKHGYRRGHLIGAPTINQYFDSGFIVPETGVYASSVVLGGREYAGVTNIGRRPSFENEDLRSETCILGFDGDLYGECVQVNLFEYIRGEIKFPDMDRLKAQISLDAEKAISIFDNRGDFDV
jgi:riboflavin kinase/FMN adenylyltransferase